MAEILNVDFNQLPRPVRERFVAITQGKAGPTPIFQQRASGAGTFGWILLLLLALLFGAGLLVAGFGSPYGATQPVVSIVGYVLLTFLAVVSALGLIKRSLRKKAFPYTPGAYVFPADTIIVRDDKVKVLSAREIAKLDQVHHHRNGVYMHTLFTFSYTDSTRESFSVYGKPQAEAALARLRSEGAQVAEAMARRDGHQLYPLDPLFEARMAGFQPQSDPTGPVTKPLPAWTKQTALLALAAAVVLAPIGYGLRNLASDRVAFNKAESSYQYRAYINSGWLNVAEARDEFLPRALIKEALAKTDPVERVKELALVLKEPLIPAVKAEADQAMKLALHATFEKAVAAGTVSALREFQQAYPSAEDVPAAKARIHELFQKTLADFRPRASKPGSLPFVESLLAYMEKHDSPPLEVRFRRHNSKTLALADNVLARQAVGSASFASASSHFEPKDAPARESAVIAAMQKGFGAVFPTDVLPLTQGEDLNPDDKTVPATSKPSVFVDYTVGWSGSTYSDPKEGRNFVGIVFDFDVLMTLPNDSKVLELKFKVLPPQTFTVSYNTFVNPAFGAAINAASQGPSDSLVYEVMALRAFDQLSSRVQDEFFLAERTASANTP